jgi:acyl-CoA reductase-like NAD-dependent aldehyde dehydrogenase
MLQVARAYDRSPITEIVTDDADALEAKLAAAARAFSDRDGWLAPHERIDILRRLAGLIDAKSEHFSRLIAQEGGKPMPVSRSRARSTEFAMRWANYGTSRAERSRSA